MKPPKSYHGFKRTKFFYNKKAYYDLGTELGFNILKEKYHFQTCEACGDRKNFYLMPDLSLWKCINDKGYDKCKIGNLNDDGNVDLIPENILNWYKSCMSACSDVGLYRKKQEDAVLLLTHPLNKKFQLLAIADGMGGLYFGDKASNLALYEIIKWFEHIPESYFFKETKLCEELTEKLSSVFNYSKYIELTKTYRSSEEVIEYSNKILGINNVCSVRKNNHIPVEFRETSDLNILETLTSDLENMQQGGIEKIAVITKNLEQAMYLYKKIKNTEDYNINLEIISDGEHIIKKPIVIIPSYLSKGLEFDGVIVYNDLEYEYTQEEKKLYYVVCTRAQHKLNVYNEPQKILSK